MLAPSAIHLPPNPSPTISGMTSLHWCSPSEAKNSAQVPVSSHAQPRRCPTQRQPRSCCHSPGTAQSWGESRGLLAWSHHPAQELLTPRGSDLGYRGHWSPGKEGPRSLTGPDQSRCADWWSPHDSGTTMDDQAAGDPSTEAQHPEDIEQGPGAHHPDISASLKLYWHSFSLG